MIDSKYRAILDDVEKYYGGEGKKTWKEFDLDFLAFAKCFIIGKNDSPSLTLVLNEAYYYDILCRYIKGTDDHKSGNGYLRKSWRDSLMGKGDSPSVFSEILNVNHGSFKNKIKNLIGVDKTEELDLQFLSFYNFVFLYFLASLSAPQSDDSSFLDRDIAMISFLQESNPSSAPYNQIHKDFLNYWYSSFLNEQVIRNLCQFYSTPFFHSLRSILEKVFFEGRTNNINYKILLEDYGLLYMPISRRKEALFALNYNNDINFSEVFKKLFTFATATQKDLYFNINTNKEVILEKTLDNALSTMFGIIRSSDKSCHDINRKDIEDLNKELPVVLSLLLECDPLYFPPPLHFSLQKLSQKIQNTNNSQTLNDWIRQSQIIFKKLMYFNVCQNSHLKHLSRCKKLKNIDYYLLYQAYFLYKDSYLEVKDTVISNLFKDCQKELHDLFPSVFFRFNITQFWGRPWIKKEGLKEGAFMEAISQRNSSMKSVEEYTFETNKVDHLIRLGIDEEQPKILQLFKEILS